MTIFSNTLILNSQRNNLKKVININRLFHSGEILYSENKDNLLNSIQSLNIDENISNKNNDSMLEERIKNLKSEEQNLLEDSNITEFDPDKLRDFTEFNEFIKISEINSGSDSNIDSNNYSSFLEAFPDYNENQQTLIKSILKKIYNLDFDSLINIINSKGLREGIHHIINHYPMFTFMSVKKEGEEITPETIQSLKSEINDVKNKMSALITRTEDNEDKIDKIYNLADEGSNILNRVYQHYKNGHLTSANLAVKGVFDIASIVSPFLAYRMMLKTYINYIDPVKNKSHLTAREMNKHMVKRANYIKQFQLVVLPFIGALTVYRAMQVSNINLGFNVNVEIDNNNSENLNPKTSLLFLGLNKILGKYFYITLIIIIILFKYLFLPYVKVQYPLFYENMINFVSNNMQYIPVLLILWFFMVCFYNFIQLYLYLKYYISNDELYLPKLLPNFTKKWLTELYEISKSDEKNDYLLIFSKFLFFSLLVAFLTFTLSYLYFY